MTQPNFTIRATIARERLSERLALNAGTNPHSGAGPSDKEAPELNDETDEERADRLAYRQTFRDRAVSEIAGLMDGSHIRVWRALSDGSMALVAPLWAGQAFFEEGRDADALILDREEWDRVFSLCHPLTELGAMTAAFLTGAAADVHALAPEEDAVMTSDPLTTKRRGRTPGSGGFGRADKPLLAEMQQLIADGMAASPNDAARIVAPKARGASVSAAQDRLRKAYRKLEGNGA